MAVGISSSVNPTSEVDCGMFRAEDSGATLDTATGLPATGDLDVRST